MRSPELLIADSIGETFANYLKERTSDASGLFVSGGSTGPKLFGELVADNIVPTNFTSQLIAQVDERVVPIDSAESNYYWFRTDFLDHFQRQEAVVTDFRPMVDRDLSLKISDLFSGRKVEGEPERHDTVLIAKLRQCAIEITNGYEEFVHDYIENAVVHLGIGSDGHIASLFPGSEALESKRYVDINFDNSGLNKHLRTTLTFEALMKARQVVIVVSGGAKAEIVRKVLRSTDMPASKILSRDTTWILDKEAARELAT